MISLDSGNKGMYVETIVNNTCAYYLKLCQPIFFEKRNIPIKIIKKINESTIVGHLDSKSYVDYFGFFNGKHLEFEVKQTAMNFFDMSYIKKHQINYLINRAKCGDKCFLIIHFDLYEKTILISVDNLLNCFKLIKKNKIPFDIILQNGFCAKIIAPGIFNIIEWDYLIN